MSKNIKGCFLHESDHWRTPRELYRMFMRLGYVDPCPYKCKVDNLQKEYKNQKLYINPPFSQLDQWTDFAINCARNGCEVYLLMPTRTDTRYFSRLSGFGCNIYFFTGCLHFSESKSVAPFPTMLVHLFHESRCVFHTLSMLEFIDFMNIYS